jgi:hypothetical protein
MDKMKGMVYKAMGVFTLDPMSGDFNGYWFDNWRGVSKGIGKRDGDTVTMAWESPMGSETRTIEKIGEDNMVMTFKVKDPTGKEVEGRSEFTRKKRGA